MGAINDIFTTFGDEYMAHYGNRMPEHHKKAVYDITSCRTKTQGLAVYQCLECGSVHTVYKSCGNRHCPACQHHKTRQWLEQQRKRTLPGHHFMITFTMPQEIRDFIRGHQRVCYHAMFKASSESIKKLVPDDKFLGADLPGFFGVLHTWGRQLQYHPHIHYIVSGGAVSKNDHQWHPSRTDFFLPVHALSKIYQAKFKHEMHKAELVSKIPKGAWETDWNVNCKPVATQEHCLEYLAPYVFRVAMANSRIVKVKDRRVFFTYRKKGSRRMRTTSLEVMEFMRRFLQHVLPWGFMKVRYYGFLHPSCPISLQEISRMICEASGLTVPDTRETEPRTRATATCPDCGGVMICCCLILPDMVIRPARYG
jgi:hypothetical protein